MTIATYTVTENAATSVARQIVIGVRAKSGSSIPSKAADWKGGVFPTMTFNLAAGATTATATIETVGNAAVDGDREFEFYTVSQSPTGGTVTMSPSFGKIVDDDTVQPIVVSPYLYSDDLEAAAVGDDVMTRPNWTAAGAATTNYKVSTAKGLYNSGVYRGVSFALYGPDLNTDGTDFGFIVEYDQNKSGIPGNPNAGTFSEFDMMLAMFFKDTSNYVRLKTNTSGIVPGFDRTVVGGSETAVSLTWRHALQTPPADMTGAASIKTRWVYHNGRMRAILPNGERALRVDGSSTVPLDSAALSGVPGLEDAASRRGKVGYWNKNGTYDFANGIRVTPLKMLVTEHARYASRTAAGSGKGRIWLSGVFRGTPTRWAYRVMTASNGSTGLTQVQDWREVTDVTIGSATFATFRYVAEIPQGGPYIIETAMTDSDGITSVAGSKRVGCGGATITYGQSNSVKLADSVNGKLSTFNRSVPSQPYLGANAAGVPAYELTGWGTDEYTFCCNVECSRIITEATNTPWLTVSTGVPGSLISFLESDATFNDKFGTTRDLIDGVIDSVIWDQGEGDRDGVDAPTYYFDKLESVYLKCVADTGNPNLLFVISPIGRFSYATPPNSGTTWARVDNYARIIKLAYDQLVNKYPGKVIYGSSKLGILHGLNDPYHYLPEGYMETSRRCGRTIAKAMGKNVPDGRGPLPTGITRSGATITVAMDMNGAATLTDLIEKATVSDNARGTPALSGALYGYEVSSDNFTSLLAISSIAPNAARNALVITLAADPGKAVSLRSYHGASYDDRYMFWGTGYANGYEDVPIWPILNYLTSAN